MRQRDVIISTTSKIAYLCRSGRLAAARVLFDEMSQRDAVSWNTMLAGYSSSGLAVEALSLFFAMRSSCTIPDAFSVTAVLGASSALRDIQNGAKLHSLILRLGLNSSLPVCNALVDMYGKCGNAPDARRVFDGMNERNEISWCSLLHGYLNSSSLESAYEVFDKMPVKNDVSWNILISGFAELGHPWFSIELFRNMQLLGVYPDMLTFISLVNACSELLPDAHFGQMVHAQIAQSGWSAAVEVSNSLLGFYCKLDCTTDALKIFESMEIRSSVSWNTMIDANMRVGNIDGALSLFSRAPEINVISWTAMISGFAKNGLPEESLAFFHEMRKDLFQLDEFIFGAVLHSYAILASLGVGRMIHGCIIHGGFASYMYIANGLVNMYAKCGDIDSSRKVFDEILIKDSVTWNTMLMAYASHGLSFKVFEVYQKMLSHNLLPDKITYICLLVACSHTGLVDKGRTLFEQMVLIHGLKPEEDHVTCFIDLLGRAGHLEEANQILNKEFRTVHGCKNESLLSACAVAEVVGLGKKVGEALVDLEPWKDAGYVMLSNLYCLNGRWKEAEDVRRKMVHRGVKKEPGCSWIEIGNSLKIFVTGNQLNVNHGEDVHLVLRRLEYEMRSPLLF